MLGRNLAREGEVWRGAMEVIVARALTKIAQDCPRKHSVLKKACRETLGENKQNRTVLPHQYRQFSTVQHTIYSSAEWSGAEKRSLHLTSSRKCCSTASQLQPQ